MCLCFCDCVLVLLAVIFPPLPVWIKRGLCSADSLINILLCCLGYFPGLLHSWYIISRYPEDAYIIFDEEQQLYIPPNQSGGHHSIYVSVSSPSATPSNHHHVINNNSNEPVDNLNQYSAITQEPVDSPPPYDNGIDKSKP